MDKYPARDFFPNIIIHNTLSIYGRMAASIWWVVLGRFMRWARWWAHADAGPIE